MVGRGGADLGPEEAEAHVAGFCVMNDWSARDLQRREMRLGLGPAKGKDFATSLGPFLVTSDELEPHRAGTAYDLPMTARVNGKEWSRGVLSDLPGPSARCWPYASRGSRVRRGFVRLASPWRRGGAGSGGLGRAGKPRDRMSSAELASDSDANSAHLELHCTEFEAIVPAGPVSR